MLEINNINKFFGGLKAVSNASMTVKKGTITGLIGPNGAGKTTLFNTIAGVYSPNSGKIFLENDEVTGLKPHMLFNKGVSKISGSCLSIDAISWQRPINFILGYFVVIVRHTRCIGFV